MVAKHALAMTYLLGNSSSLDMNYSRAFELFSQNADLGFAPSQWTVAFHYATGLGVNASQARALVYLSFAALADVREAQMALAFRYKQGLYVKQSCETALTYYRLVADHVAAGTRRPSPTSHPRTDANTLGSIVMERKRLSDTVASNSEGMVIHALASYADLLHFYSLNAERGDPNAQLTLGQVRPCFVRFVLLCFVCLFFFGGGVTC